MACTACRQRKLRCDRNSPCTTCRRLGIPCQYEAAKKRGPRRRNVQELEARLAHLEGRIINRQNTNQGDLQTADDSGTLSGDPCWDASPSSFVQDGAETHNLWTPDEAPVSTDDFGNLTIGFDFNAGDSWDLIDLGRFERLPEPDVIDRLTNVFFEEIHPHNPIVHHVRYLADLHLAPQAQPPLCLRYIMWALAATRCPDIASQADGFYQRARQYLESDELKSVPLTFRHVQSWNLVSMYETFIGNMQCTWMSNRRAIAAAQMLGLHCLDAGHDPTWALKLSFRDEIDVEQARRAFWATFCNDRWSCTATGLPSGINDLDIMTNLPCSETAFAEGTRGPSISLSQALDHGLNEDSSPYTGMIVVVSIMSQIVQYRAALKRNPPNHLHLQAQTSPSQDFRKLDNLITSTFVTMPSSLRFRNARQGPSVAFFNMCLHAACISLHLTALDNFHDDGQTIESNARCKNAANEILFILRLLAPVDPALMNPFTGFALYLASRVLILQLSSNNTPNDAEAEENTENLRLIVTALRALQRSWKTAMTFLAQVKDDLARHGIDVSRNNNENRNEADDTDAFARRRMGIAGALLKGILVIN